MKYIAIDSNSLSGAIHLENAKTGRVDFKDSNGNQMFFIKAPRVQITPLNNTANVPFKTGNLKTGNFYTGFLVGFQNSITIDIEWQITERA